MKGILIALMMILIVLPMAIAAPVVTIQQPINKTYTYSIGVPLEFNYTGATSSDRFCSYTFDGGKANKTIPSCDNDTFNFDEDGIYNLTIYVQNTTDNTIGQASRTLEIQRNINESTGWVILLSIIILLILTVGFFIFSFRYDSPNPLNRAIFQMIFFAAGLLMLFLTITTLSVLQREYLKFPYIDSTLSMVITVISWAFPVIFLFILFAQLLAAIEEMKKLNLEGRGLA